MKSILLAIIFSLSISAQVIAPDAAFLTSDQVQRLEKRQAAIREAQAAFQLELYAIRDELGVTSRTHGDLKQFPDGKLGFEKKAEPKK